MDSFDDFQGSLSFVILSAEPNIARLRDTVRSIKNNFPSVPTVCAVEKGIKKPQMDEMKEVCPTIKGGDTVTSLINKGMEAVRGEGWRLFVMEGARVPSSIVSRYSRWIKGHRDVLFPIVVNHDREGRPMKILSSFEECTLNGMLIHSRLFGEVGPFSENPIGVSKSFWAFDAHARGAVFKAVLGVTVI